MNQDTYVRVIKKSYLHIVKYAAGVTLDVDVSEVEGHLLTDRQLDQIDALPVVGVVVGPVGGDEDGLTVSEGTPTTRVT